MAADAHYASSAMPKYYPHPPWHPMYSLARDAVEQVLKLCATNVYLKMKAAVALQKAEELTADGALQFHTSSPTDTNVPTTASPPTLMYVPPLDETDIMLNNVSAQRWRVDE